MKAELKNSLIEYGNLFNAGGVKGKMGMLVDIAVQHLVADNGWIECSDRLPEEGEAVLVCDSNNVIFCAEMYDGEFQPDDFPNVPKQGAKITHWRPLPAPPLGPLDH